MVFPLWKPLHCGFSTVAALFYIPTVHKGSISLPTLTIFWLFKDLPKKCGELSHGFDFYFLND
jgi:hypothetical protein